MNKKIFQLSTWIIFFLFSLFIYSIIHESVHVLIYKDFGINATIKIDLKSFRTEAHIENIPLDEYKEVRRLQLITEIVGYHLLGFLIALGILLLWYKLS